MAKVQNGKGRTNVTDDRRICGSKS